MSKRLKNKLVLGALGIVVFVIGLSTVATSLLISTQSQRSAHEVLRQAGRVIQDELAARRAALLTNCEQIATSQDMGDNIRFLGEEKFTGGVEDFLDATYRDVAAQLYAICRTGHVWEAAIYDSNGYLTSFVAIDADTALLGYPRSDGFVVARLMPEQELTDESWRKADAVEHFQRTHEPEVMAEQTAHYETTQNALCVEAHVPVLGDVFNVATKQHEPRQVGFVLARRRIGDDFVERIGRITGTSINVFTRNGLAVGEVPEYDQVDYPEAFRSDHSEIGEAGAIPFSKRTLADQSFYQVVLPLPGHGQWAGAIAALYSQGIAKAATSENVRVLCLISVLCVLVIVPITFVFSARLTRPIEGMVKTAEVIAGGNYDASIPLVEREDEIGSLSRSFSRMRNAVREHVSELAAKNEALAVENLERRRAEKDLAELNLTLEHRVAQRTEELRKVNESMLRITTAVDKCSDGIAMVDADGAHFYQNRAFTELFGYEVGEFATQGGPAVTYVDKDVARKVFAEIMAGRSWSGEIDMLARDGRRIPILLRADAIKDNRGQIVGLIGIHTDITERRQAEERLQQAKDAAEAATQAKSAFLANMSHEIRTPMTSILGFTENLLDPRLSDSEKLNAVHTVRRNGEHLLQIINDILDISKIEAGKVEVERIRYEPIRLVADVKSLMQVRANAKNLPFSIEYTGAVPETIESDPTRLKQILVNLVGNAIKFTETGGVRLITRLIDDAGEHKLQFDIIDTGPGMTEEQVGRLFQAFTQGDTSTTRRFGGTGLGLMISKRLAEMLGGTITVDSRPGEGSLFRLTVATGPLDGVKMLDDPAAATIARPETDVTAKVGVAKLGCSILLAEDGPDNQRLIAHVLRRAGAEVTVVQNGKLAVDAALAAVHGRREGDPKCPYDVILMDMQMPVMDGYEATALLRQRGYTGPIIALTAHAMASDRQKCIDAGCDDYATKPIDRKKLIATIQQSRQKSLRPETEDTHPTDTHEATDALVGELADDPDMAELSESFATELTGS